MQIVSTGKQENKIEDAVCWSFTQHAKSWKPKLKTPEVASVHDQTNTFRPTHIKSKDDIWASAWQNQQNGM